MRDRPTHLTKVIATEIAMPNYHSALVLREGDMSFHGIIDPETMEMLTQILNAHCDRYGIRSPAGREFVAASLLNFYERGVADDLALVELLEREDLPDRRPVVERRQHRNNPPAGPASLQSRADRHACRSPSPAEQTARAKAPIRQAGHRFW